MTVLNPTTRASAWKQATVLALKVTLAALVMTSAQPSAAHAQPNHPEYVPEDTVAIIAGDIDRMKDQPAVQKIVAMLEHFPNIQAQLTQHQLLDNIDAFSWVLPPSQPGPLLIASTTLDANTFLNGTGAAFTTSQHLDITLHTLKDNPSTSLAFPKPGVLLVGSAAAIQAALDRASAQPGGTLPSGLAEVVQAADTAPSLWFAVNVSETLLPKLSSELPIFTDLHSASGALHFAEGFSFELRFRFHTVEGATRFHTKFSREIEAANVEHSMLRLGFGPLVNSAVLTQSDIHAYLHLSITGEQLQRMLDVTRSIVLPNAQQQQPPPPTSP